MFKNYKGKCNKYFTIKILSESIFILFIKAENSFKQSFLGSPRDLVL